MTAILNPNVNESHFSDIDVKEMLRPAVVKEDVKLMQQRQRVSTTLKSTAFRSEIEKIVASQMHEGSLSPAVLALKQIIDVLTPHTKLGSSTFSKGVTLPITPINDVRTSNCVYSKSEKMVRCKLASTFRLVDIFGWCTGSNSHISTKIFKDSNTYLFNPRGLLFHEITAASLIKVELGGAIIDDGITGLGLCKQDWMLHSVIYEALPIVRCIIHLNTPAVIAVTSMKTGLLPISQEAMMLGAIATYDPTVFSASTTTDKVARVSEESATIKQCLSKVGEPKLLIIKNFGILVLGRSIEDAWMSAYLTTSACESQLRLACLGADELILPSNEMAESAFLASMTHVNTQLLNSSGVATGSSTNWRPGELEFEAMMRRLDSAGYRTGHIYRLNQVHQTSVGYRRTETQSTILEDTVDGEVSTSKSAYGRRAASLGRSGRLREDVEVPPSASSFSTNYYSDGFTRLKAAAEHRAKTMSLQRTHWSTTPNAYQREDIEEVGTSNPKKIPHWIEGGKKTTGGITVTSEDPNQFAPQGADPLELQGNLKKVRANYYKDVRNAGPQSKILDGIDNDEDITDGLVSSHIISPRGTLRCLDPANPHIPEPGHVVMVGAASKGIIKRDQRNNVELFKSVFSPNPFEQVTDDDINRYKRNVERRAKGMLTEEEEESEALKQHKLTTVITPRAESDLERPFNIKRQVSFEASTLADLPSSILASTFRPYLFKVDSVKHVPESAFLSARDVSVGTTAMTDTSVESLSSELSTSLRTPKHLWATPNSLSRPSDKPSVHRPHNRIRFLSIQAGDLVSCTNDTFSRLSFQTQSNTGIALSKMCAKDQEGIKSDTSHGEFSANEKIVIEVETKNRKKRRFKLPFSRRGKDKSKDASKI